MTDGDSENRTRVKSMTELSLDLDVIEQRFWILVGDFERAVSAAEAQFGVLEDFVSELKKRKEKEKV